MKVFALTLTLLGLGLASLAQARSEYRLQCAPDEIGIRWPSYFSNSEYYVCQGLYGNQLTVNCAAGEVFSFVLQQCASPAKYVPAPPMNSLPTAAPITMQLVQDTPQVIGELSVPVHPAQFPHHEEDTAVHALPLDPTPPTPPTEPPTPPTVTVVDAPKPGRRPLAPVPAPNKSTSAAKKTPVPVPSKAATAKKPAVPTPAKAAKKPTPPSKAQKKPAQA